MIVERADGETWASQRAMDNSVSADKSFEINAEWNPKFGSKRNIRVARVPSLLQSVG